MLHAAILGWILFATWRWGKWKDWRLFLPTIYFMLSCNMLYQYISYSMKPLWEMENPIISIFITDIIYNFIIFPCLVILFVGNYPKGEGVGKIAFHYLKWLAISLSLEGFALYFGYLKYMNGFTFGWTILFYFIMYPMLRLHHTSPKIAIILTPFIIAFYLAVFQYDVL